MQPAVPVINAAVVTRHSAAVPSGQALLQTLAAAQHSFSGAMLALRANGYHGKLQAR